MSDPAALSRGRILAVFLAFAWAYLLSAMLRAVTATLAPVFSTELDLQAGELGLLAGAYFLGFAAMQLPVGAALDRFGPRRVLLALLLFAVLGCAGFASARSLGELVAARGLIGVGVAACLMAPLTCYRRILPAAAQLQANSWMLMVGSLGMVVSTVPVQALLPLLGWRGVFWVAGGALMVALAAIAIAAPSDPVPAVRQPSGGYREIAVDPLFIRMAPLGLFNYGGLIAIQTLWVGPWLTRVCGWTPQAAAEGLLAINLCMLLAFLAWGMVIPELSRRGLHATRLMAWGLPISLIALAVNVALGSRATALHWIVWFVSSSVCTLSQPAMGQAFALDRVGRALSGFNLVVFVGVFALQWAIGVAIDRFQAAGLAEADAFRVAFAAYGAACLLCYLWFIRRRSAVVDNAPSRHGR